MKISFFLGRIHHAQKLLPVAAAMHQAEIEVEILIANNSVNIDPSTEYLHNFGITQFHHVYDYISGNNDIDTIVDHTEFPYEMFKHVPPFWAMSSIREVAECLVGFEEYLNVNEPDAVFGLHENNFWVKILFYLARQQGIKTYSLQEGIILEREEHDLKKYSIGTKYTDTLFSWSGYDRRFYSEPDKIIPVGPAHLDEWIKIARHAKKYRDTILSIKSKLGIDPHSTVVVFAPPRLDLYRGNFTRVLDLLIDWTRDRGIVLLLSLHPFQGGVEELKNIPNIYPHMLVRHDISGLEYVVIADALITQTSTIAIEALLLGTPVIEIDVDYIGLEQPLWKHDAADLIEGDNLDKISQVVHGDCANPRKFIEDRFPLADGESAKRIVEEILNVS